jgi:hypothetical protein
MRRRTATDTPGRKTGPFHARRVRLDDLDSDTRRLVLIMVEAERNAQAIEAAKKAA